MSPQDYPEHGPRDTSMLCTSRARPYSQDIAVTTPEVMRMQHALLPFAFPLP